MSRNRPASNRQDSRWKRLRRRFREWEHHARQYRDELDEQRLRFGLERANRELRSLGCEPRTREVDKSRSEKGLRRRLITWLRKRGFPE